MTASNLAKFLEQLSASDCMLEALQDHSSTFQNLLEPTIDISANKKETSQNLEDKKTSTENDLNSKKRFSRSLQEKWLKIEEAIEKEDEAVKTVEKERDGLMKEYIQSVDELHHKLSSISNEFNPNTLKQTIRELKQDGNKIESHIAKLFKQKQILCERMSKLNMELPDSQALKNAKDKIFNENDRYDMNSFINDFKAKIGEVHK